MRPCRWSHLQIFLHVQNRFWYLDKHSLPFVGPLKYPSHPLANMIHNLYMTWTILEYQMEARQDIQGMKVAPDEVWRATEWHLENSDQPQKLNSSEFLPMALACSTRPFYSPVYFSCWQYIQYCALGLLAIPTYPVNTCNRGMGRVGHSKQEESRSPQMPK